VLKTFHYRLIVALGAVCVVLVAGNAWLSFENRAAQTRLNARAQYIQQSQAIGSLYQEIARSLAKLAIDNHDEQLRAMLAGEGFTIGPPQSSGPAPTASGKP
jgi:hypothetical protein